VVRTDREHAFYKNDDSPYLVKLKSILVTYCFYNFDIGYVQGMNDYLSPILIVMQDENDAFWCFKGWMDIVVSVQFSFTERKLWKSLSHIQLFFCVNVVPTY
jgi:hypothetical protein